MNSWRETSKTLRTLQVTGNWYTSYAKWGHFYLCNYESFKEKVILELNPEEKLALPADGSWE